MVDKYDNNNNHQKMIYSGWNGDSGRSIVHVSDKEQIGDGFFVVIAGPCSVESQEQVLSIANAVKEHGAKLFRGGVFKPRTSPYEFQGIGVLGLEFLKEVRETTGLPIVSEIVSIAHLDYFAEIVDVIQIGSRNMSNYELLKEVGKLQKPVLLKRGQSATIEEFLYAAEYVMGGGTKDVILCERGIRALETNTRFTLDITAIPVLKEKTHLPIIVDPSHAVGRFELVEPLALASVAAGADGLLVEVHNNPDESLCDARQALTISNFNKMMRKIERVLKAINAE